MDVLVAIVLYNKNIDELDYIYKLKNVDILIYDNSLTPQQIPSNVHYYHNRNNDGVSAAYNYSIDLAEKMNKKYLILLDQDTSFNLETLEKYNKYKDKYGLRYIYAPIARNKDKVYSPFIEGKWKNHTQNFDSMSSNEIYNIKGKSIINSGMMIPLDVVEKTGRFNEKIKLDFSDIYFIENYKKTYKEIILMDINLDHQLSGDEGKNKQKEIHRFKYYCNGAKEYKKTTENPERLNRMVFMRMLRLMVKYKTMKPIGILKQYYGGDVII